MESFEEYIAKYSRAVEEARRRRPLRLTGETYPVGMESRIEQMDRAHVEAMLQAVCPRGLGHLYHHLRVTAVDIGGFEAACGHFGLRGVLRDITREEVAEEMRARRGRGDAPSTGLLPARLDEHYSREEADARIAIVARRIAVAGAGASGIPAAAPSA